MAELESLVRWIPPAQIWQLAPRHGPPGKVRRTAPAIALWVVTFGLYGLFYLFYVHPEMKRHTGRGIGGGGALAVTLCAWVAMPFVTASEVGRLYSGRGQRPRVTGWTGLWAVARGSSATR